MKKIDVWQATAHLQGLIDIYKKKFAFELTFKEEMLIANVAIAMLQSYPSEYDAGFWSAVLEEIQYYQIELKRTKREEVENEN